MCCLVVGGGRFGIGGLGGCVVDELTMSSGNGVLVIHRDIPGEHGDEHCWCCPHIIPDDTLMTPREVVEMVSVKEFRQ
jgi:hypothetical protein